MTTYKEEKELLKLKKALVELEHKNKMEFVKYVRETERMKHEWELERGRIKTAEIRKSQMRRESGNPYKY